MEEHEILNLEGSFEEKLQTLSQQNIKDLGTW